MIPTPWTIDKQPGRMNVAMGRLLTRIREPKPGQIRGDDPRIQAIAADVDAALEQAILTGLARIDALDAARRRTN